MLFSSERTFLCNSKVSQSQYAGSYDFSNQQYLFSALLVRTLCTFLSNAPFEDTWPPAQEQHIKWFSRHLNNKMFKMHKDEKDNQPKQTLTLPQLLVMTLEFMSAAQIPSGTATSRIFSDCSGSGGDGCLWSATQEVAGDTCSRWSQNR